MLLHVVAIHNNALVIGRVLLLLLLLLLFLLVRGVSVNLVHISIYCFVTTLLSLQNATVLSTIVSHRLTIGVHETNAIVVWVTIWVKDAAIFLIVTVLQQWRFNYICFIII